MNKENIIASKSDPLSYATILMDRNNFRKSGTRSGSEFNYFDTPRQTYFKILFYFCNGDADGNINNNTGYAINAIASTKFPFIILFSFLFPLICIPYSLFNK